MNRLGLAILMTLCMAGLAACYGEPDSRPNPGGQAQPGQASQPGQIRPGAAVGDSAPQSTQVGFDAADQNKDGMINRAEASAVSGLNFTSADADRDEGLSRQEFAAAQTNPRPRD
jgi:hypothetical protein